MKNRITREKKYNQKLAAGASGSLLPEPWSHRRDGYGRQLPPPETPLGTGLGLKKRPEAAGVVHQPQPRMWTRAAPAQLSAALSWPPLQPI